MDTPYSLKLPPKNYRRIIEELSVVIPDPALKLKFLKQAIDEHQKISPTHKLYPPIAVVSFRKKLLDHAEKIWPGSKKAAKHLIRKGTESTPHNKILRLYKLRYAIGSVILMFLIGGVGTAVTPLVRSFTDGNLVNLNSAETRTSITKIIIRKPIIGDQRPRNGNSPSSSIFVKSVNNQNGTDQVLKYLQSPVLTALAPLRTQNTTSDLTAEKLFLVAQPSVNKNHSRSHGVISKKLQKKQRWMLAGFLDNPILLALSQQKSNNPDTDHIFHQPLLSSKTHLSQDNRTISNIKSTIQPQRAQEVLKYYQIPALIALNSHRTVSSKADRIARKPLLSSQLSKTENRLLANIKPEKQLAEGQGVSKYFQNPVLIALSSHRTISSQPDRMARMPLLSSQISQTENRLLANIKPEKQLTEDQGVLQYFQNPILIALASQQITNSKPDRIIRKPILSSKPPESEIDSSSAVVHPPKYANKPVKVPKYLKIPIWLVEKTSDREFYSNRLQIITTHTISNIPREYYRFPKNSNNLPSNSKIADKISGIVYHASESDIYPFMPEMNHSILKYSKQLIRYLQRKKSYHFFIDRFGRVYRLVREDHAAFHAGNSIWADDKEIYLNLNHAFIGICFEGKDFEEINIKKQKKGQSKKSKQPRLRPTGISSFNEAQLRSGKELTDWLRVKYNIPQQNCVPHALISVNPHRMLIGYHLDLARGFPFAKFGLSDKYQEPLPSMIEFGFLYDNYFEKIFNGKLWRGIRFSEEILQRKAENSGMSFSDYRKSLQRRFSRYAEWNKKMLETKDQLAQNPKKN